jgi:peptide/nickel transport system ATP-binding protein
MSVLSVQNLWVTNPQAESSQAIHAIGPGIAYAIEGVSLEVAAGEIIGIVGESSGGKSTLSQAIMGLLPVGSQIEGDILFDGQSVLEMNAESIGRLRREIGSIFGEPLTQLDPLMTVGNHCLEILQVHEPNLTKRQAKRRAVATFAALNIPEYRWHQYPHELGELKLYRLAIAIALLLDPKLIIVEDLMTNLDVPVATALLNELTRLCRARQIGLLFIASDIATIALYCDRIVVLDRGRQVESGTIERITIDPQVAYTQKLVRSALQLRPQTMPTQWLWQPASERQLLGTKSISMLPLTQPILTLDRLQQDYGAAPSLIERLFSPNSTPAIDRSIDRLHLEIYEGEIFGLVGARGCGKTTLLRTILQLIPAASGTITFCGEELTYLPPEAIRIVCRRLQAVFHNSSAALNPMMTIGQSIADPRIIHELDDTPAQTRSQVLTMLERVGLNPAAEYFDMYPDQLSSREQLRVGIARALTMQPKLVIFDDPVRLLAPIDRANILDLLLELQRESHLTYLFMTRDLHLARSFCDRIAMMDRGRIFQQVRSKG